MTRALPARVDRAVAAGAKKRDYPFTVLAVDPVALPLLRVLGRVSWVTPAGLSWLSLALGLPVGVAFATGTRAGLIVGAVLWYASFLFDCIDGKLARLRGVTSARGKKLDTLGDGARRASSILGLVVYLWDVHGRHEAYVAAVFGILAFYVIELSGGEISGVTEEPKGRWSTALARYRLLPLPGMTDVSAVVFVIGPLTGLVVAGVITGLVLVVGGLVRTYWNVARMPDRERSDVAESP